MLMQKLGFMERMGRTAGVVVLLATCMLQPAFAYDSESWRPRLTL